MQLLGSLSDTKSAVSLSRLDNRLFCTAGCHPTRCLEFQTGHAEYLAGLQSIIEQNTDKVVAIGECGLDYDRLVLFNVRFPPADYRIQFCPASVQLEYFDKQLSLAGAVDLPLFLHCRAAHSDLIRHLKQAREAHFGNRSLRGVVHTFDGDVSDAENILELGLYVGLNGCSLKTEENLKVIESLPPDRILFETDAPWCEIRPSHAGYRYIQTHFTARKSDRWESGCLVKGRNEPVNLIQVLEVVASVKEMSIDELEDQVYRNTLELFQLHSVPDS